MSGLGSLNACHVVPVHNPLGKVVKSSKFHSTYSLKKNYRSCRACITKPPPNISIEIGSGSAVKCTYGDHNSQWLSLELQHLLSMQKDKPSSGIVLTRGKWRWVLQEESLYQLSGIMRFHNVTKRNEVFITEVQGRLRLFSTECLDGIATSIKIISRHPGGKPAPRNDGYWPVFIIRAEEDTSIEVVIQVTAEGEKTLKDLQAIRVELEYVAYGPHGRSTHLQHVILPLQYTQSSHGTLSWKKVGGTCSVLPVRTHLLFHLDDPVQVLKSYILPHAKAGDVITIGETPFAIMQEGFS